MQYGFQNNLHLEITIIYYLSRFAARPLINSLKTPYSLPEGRNRCSFQRAGSILSIHNVNNVNNVN